MFVYNCSATVSPVLAVFMTNIGLWLWKCCSLIIMQDVVHNHIATYWCIGTPTANTSITVKTCIHKLLCKYYTEGTDFFHCDSGDAQLDTTPAACSLTPQQMVCTYHIYIPEKHTLKADGQKKKKKHDWSDAEKQLTKAPPDGAQSHWPMDAAKWKEVKAK